MEFCALYLLRIKIFLKKNNLKKVEKKKLENRCVKEINIVNNPNNVSSRFIAIEWKIETLKKYFDLIYREKTRCFYCLFSSNPTHVRLVSRSNYRSIAKLRSILDFRRLIFISITNHHECNGKCVFAAHALCTVNCAFNQFFDMEFIAL